MTHTVRFTSAVVMCVGILLSGVTSPTPAQTLREPLGSTITPISYPHHVVGTLIFPAGCSPSNTGSSNGITMTLMESWYVDQSVRSGPPTLVPAGDTLVGLTTRTLGQAQVNLTNGTFDVLWSEPALLNRVPWGPAKHIQTGAAVTAYRILTLRASGALSSSLQIDSTALMIPMVTFFGREGIKNVGPVPVRCFSISG